MARTIESLREQRLNNIKQTVSRIQVRLDFGSTDIIAGEITSQKLEYVCACEIKRLERELKALYKILPSKSDRDASLGNRVLPTPLY